MRARRFMLALSAIAALAGCGGPEPDRQAVIEANRLLDQRCAEGFRTKNLEQIMSCWWNSPETRHIPADNVGVHKGFEFIRAAMKLQLAGIEKVLTYEFVDQDYRIFGDAVVGSGRIRFSLQPRGAPNPVAHTVFYTDIRQNKNGMWVYVYGHESLPPTPAMENLAAGE